MKSLFFCSWKWSIKIAFNLTFWMAQTFIFDNFQTNLYFMSDDVFFFESVSNKMTFDTI